MRELDQDSNLDRRYREVYTKSMKQEFDCITKWIEGCQIPITLNHWDCHPSNLIYDKESGQLTLIDYELVDTQPFTHDLGRYIFGLLGNPWDVSKYNEARMKQFVKFYLEEKYILLKKPLSELTQDVIEEVFYWTQLSYTFVVFMFAVYTGWWKNNLDYTDTPQSVDLDHFDTFTKPLLNEYFRMKDKLLHKNGI